MPPSLSCRINPQPRALHALSLLTQLLSEAYGSTFHFDIASVVYDMGRGVLKEKDPLSMVIMAGAFMVVCVFEVNVIYVVIASGLIGAVRTWIQERRAKA